MRSNDYDELLMRVEQDLVAHGLEAVVLDTMPLKENSGLDGVAYLKGNKAYIFIDKTLATFDKARTLVEEYHHAISDLGDHLDYDAVRAYNNEVSAREEVIAYMTSPEDLVRVAHYHEDEPFAAWMLTEHLGYPADFAEETVAYYRRRGLIPG